MIVISTRYLDFAFLQLALSYKTDAGFGICAKSCLGPSPIAFLLSLRKTLLVQTVLTTSAAEASEFVKDGGIVAFPTETVYGLAASIFDEAAIRRVFEAKRRPCDNPLIAHISSVEQIQKLVTESTEISEILIKKFFPGPLTVVLKKSESVPEIATAGLDTIGIRMPRNELANQFIAASGVPLVAPSANVSGRPSPTNWQAVFEDLNGRIDCILQGDPTEIGLESTVVDCTVDPPRLLRTGAVSIEQLREVVPTIEIGGDSGSSAKSPGLRHRHYSPSAKIIVVGGGDKMPNIENSGYIGLSDPNGTPRMKKICANVDDYARSVFEFFRECDRAGIKTIYCEEIETTGIGAALMDRVSRAAK